MVRILLAALTVAASASPLFAQRAVVLGTPSVVVCPPSVVPVCPPGNPSYVVPGMPGTPAAPSTLPGTELPGQPPIAGESAPNLTTPIQETLTGGNPFAQADNSLGSGFNRSAAPNSFGDFGSLTYSRIETIPVSRTIVVGFTERQVGVTETVTIVNNEKVVTRTPIIERTPVTREEVVNERRVVRLPLGSRYNGIKISENDNPRPQDRVYFGYNYFDGVNRALNPGLGRVDMERQTIGFEKTLLNGDASLGLRLPFVQLRGDGSIDSSVIGDLSIIAKFAFLNTNESVRALGLVVTAPTGGGDAILLDGFAAPHSTILQPWVGFYETLTPRLYALGFSSLIVPTDSRDVTLLSNSVTLGWWLTRSTHRGRVTGIVPATEVHINTPLNHRSISNGVFLQDQVNLTNGLHIVLPRATVAVGVNTPLVGPRPWNSEFVLTVNWNF